MRLKSEVWVGAYLRSWFAGGGFGAVLRKGAAEAGAVYVVVNRLDGSASVFGPAPGPAHDERGDRRWAPAVHEPLQAFEVTALIDRLARIDPDIWVIEVEDRTGSGGLALVDNV